MPMLELSALLLILALVIRLCPEIPFSRLLSDRLIAKTLSWLATGQPLDFLYLIIVLSMFVAAGETVALLESAEFFLVHSADITLYLHAIVVPSVLVAVCRGKFAVQARRAKQSFWHVQAIDVSSTTFGQAARHKRGGFSSADNDDDDDPALEIIIAA